MIPHPLSHLAQGNLSSPLLLVEENNTMKEAKQRYFDRVYANANTIECACGCGTKIKDKDRYGREKKYVNGHNGRKYKDPTEHKRMWNHRNREQRLSYKMRRGRRLKQELLERHGGECAACGYKATPHNECVFDFHHNDPSEKEFALNQSSIQRYSLEKIHKEAKKCTILCANCHRLHHRL